MNPIDKEKAVHRADQWEYRFEINSPNDPTDANTPSSSRWKDDAIAEEVRSDSSAASQWLTGDWMLQTRSRHRKTVAWLLLDSKRSIVVLRSEFRFDPVDVSVRRPQSVEIRRSLYNVDELHETSHRFVANTVRLWTSLERSSSLTSGDWCPSSAWTCCNWFFFTHVAKEQSSAVLLARERGRIISSRADRQTATTTVSHLRFSIEINIFDDRSSILQTIEEGQKKRLEYWEE